MGLFLFALPDPFRKYEYLLVDATKTNLPMDTKLICTFTDTESLKGTLKDIKSAYTLAFGKVYVLENEDDLSELFCTFNINPAKRNVHLPRTISIHRKKDYNALYTINALNKLIRRLNGEPDPTYSVPWQNYKNTLLLTNQGELNIIDTDLFMIADTKDIEL